MNSDQIFSDAFVGALKDQRNAGLDLVAQMNARIAVLEADNKKLTARVKELEAPDEE